MVSALVSVITYLMIGMFVATFLEVLENKHPKTIFADRAFGQEGTDWYYFVMTVLFFPLAILTEIGVWLHKYIRALFEKIRERYTCLH